MDSVGRFRGKGINEVKTVTPTIRMQYRIIRRLMLLVLTVAFAQAVPGLNSSILQADGPCVCSSCSFYGKGHAADCLAPKSWSAMRKENVVMQRYDYSCGAGVLATLLTYYWNDPTGEEDILVDLMNRLTPAQLEDRTKEGLTITDLKNIAIHRGYRAVIGTLDGVHNLREAKVPVIVVISPKGYNHFVIVRGVIGDYVYISDPIRGNLRLTTHDFACQWVKNAVLVVLHEKMDTSPCSRMVIPFREFDPQYANRPYVRRMINQFLP